MIGNIPSGSPIIAQPLNNNFQYLDDSVKNSIKENIGYGTRSGLSVSAQTVPNMTVSVSGGIAYLPSGRRVSLNTTTLNIANPTTTLYTNEPHTTSTSGVFRTDLFPITNSSGNHATIADVTIRLASNNAIVNSESVTASTGFIDTVLVAATAIRATYHHGQQRIDIIVINSSGNLQVIQGISSNSNPSIPNVPSGAIALARVFVQPKTSIGISTSDITKIDGNKGIYLDSNYNLVIEQDLVVKGSQSIGSVTNEILIVRDYIQNDQNTAVTIRDGLQVEGNITSSGSVNGRNLALDGVILDEHILKQASLSSVDIIVDKHISNVWAKNWEDHRLSTGNPHSSNHNQLANIGQVSIASTDAIIDKHVSNLLAKGWEDHRISAHIALGETSATAYRGDRGKVAHDHALSTGTNPHVVTHGQTNPSAVDIASTDATRDKHLSNGLAKGWEDHRIASAPHAGHAPSSHVGTGASAHSTATTLIAGFMSGEMLTKLNTIETGATGDLTAIEILDLLRTVDGANSGLDADLLDGLTSASFAPVEHNHSILYYDRATIDSSLALKLNTSAYTADDVLIKLRTVDGPGSGIDADLLDGLNASAFSLTSHNHNFSALTDVTITGVANNHIIVFDATLGRYTNKTAANAGLSASSHDHNTIYFTKTELNTSAGAGQVHWDRLLSRPDVFTPAAHDHDTRYTTTSSLTALLLGKSDTSHTHVLLHDSATVSGNGISIAGQQISLSIGTGATQISAGNHTHSQLHDRSHAITSTGDHTAGNWRLFHSNATGQVVELAFGTSGQFLRSNGISSAPSFDAVPVISVNGRTGAVSLTHSDVGAAQASHSSTHLPDGVDSLTTGSASQIAVINASSGAANSLSRSDHIHSVLTSAPGVSTPGDIAVAGTSTALARADHVHGREAYGTPVASAPGDAITAGTATTLARSDHRHGREAYGIPGASAPGDIIAAGISTALARADHVHGREAPVIRENNGRFQYSLNGTIWKNIIETTVSIIEPTFPSSGDFWYQTL